MPVRGGATISPRWPLPIGVTRSTIRIDSSSGALSRMSRLFGCSGVRSSKLVTRPRFVGGLAVDQLDLHQGEVVLVLDRQPDRPLDDEAGPQAHPPDLARRDVDVFRAGEVVVGGAAEEAVAVGQDFERAGAADDLAALDLPADDADDELGPVHAGVLVDALFLRQS